MFNVLVVDDEWMICMGVATVLMNADIGIGEVFMASNGFEALDYLRLESVDLLITDIQMELMNGIELIETIFTEKALLPVIVLSAHGEFEYAQKALRFGVKEYIVKPVNPMELIRMSKTLLMERESQLRSLTKNAFNQKFSIEEMASNRNYILNELVSEGFSNAELDDVFQYLGHRFDGPFYSMLVIKLQLAKAGLMEEDIDSFRDRNLLRYASLNIIEETLDKWESIVFYSGNCTISVVVQITQEEIDNFTSKKEQTMIAQLLHHNLLTYINTKSVIGISRMKEGIASWVDLYREANDAIRWSDVHVDYHVFDIEDFGMYENSPSLGEMPATTQMLEDNNSFIRSAIQFMDSHYRQKGLKLQEIAESVCLSPNYLSYLFKKHRGMNLWDYVTKLRMEEGKRLILTTDMRRYEIADEVGYETPEHFSKLFKKYFGINPSEVKN